MARSVSEITRTESILENIATLREEELFQRAMGNIALYRESMKLPCDLASLSDISAQLMALLNTAPESLPVNTAIVSRGTLSQTSLAGSNNAQIYLMHYLAKKYNMDPNDAAMVFSQKYSTLFDAIIHTTTADEAATGKTSSIGQTSIVLRSSINTALTPPSHSYANAA